MFDINMFDIKKIISISKCFSVELFFNSFAFAVVLSPFFPFFMYTGFISSCMTVF